MSAVSIAKTFSASTKKLSAPDRGRVLDFLTKFLDDPSSPGLNFETIEGGRDRNMKSARITQDLRTIIHRSEGALTLLYAGHHEDAYRWAERRRVERHPVTGTVQIVETAESVREKIAAAQTEPESPALFEESDDDYLLSLGVPEEWLPTIRQVQNEDQLLTVVSKLPEEVAERLLTLATGELVTPPPPVSPSLPAEQHPDNLRRFWVVQDAAELAEILNKPLEDWIRFLHPSQRRIVTATFNGPAKVSGAAGTGKTVVGMHRACELASRGKRVLLASFVTTLCRNLEHNVRILCEGLQPRSNGSVVDRITVSTVHKQALSLAQKLDPKIRPLDNDKLEPLINRHHARGDHSLDAGFLLSEWTGVVEPQGITTWEEYRDAARTGRGSPLSVKQRKSCWKVFDGVYDDLNAAHTLPWSGICRLARTAFETGKAESPFDAVIVDEIQDLQPQELKLLSALAGENPGDLMLLGDAGQRIYPGGFSLKKLGIDVRGRSHILRINYRTTEQIRKFADGMLSGAGDDFNGGEEDRRSRSLLHGPAPSLHECATPREQDEFIVKRIHRLLAQGLAPQEIAIFARSGSQLRTVREALSTADIPSISLSADSDTERSEGVNLGTMHRAKGLEFKIVFVANCSQGVVPHSYTLSKMRDQGDYDTAYERERQLLYVALTRARDEVFVTWVGKRSEFLSDRAKETAGNAA